MFAPAKQNCQKRMIFLAALGAEPDRRQAITMICALSAGTLTPPRG
jgi:hypothetical protein